MKTPLDELLLKAQKKVKMQTICIRISELELDFIDGLSQKYPGLNRSAILRCLIDERIEQIKKETHE